MAPLDMKPNELESYWLPFTPNRSFKKRPRLFSGAKDMYFFTPDGRKVIDASSGLFCVNAGHGREPIVKAIQEAAARLDYAPPFQYGHPQVFELSSRLALMAPGDLEYTLFANSGSEAVDTALKVALAYHRARGEGSRTRFIGRERGYHGVGFGGISVGGMVANRKMFGNMLTGVDHLPTTYNRAKQAFSIGEPDWGAETADELERLIGLHDASTIAAVIVEPVAGSTGCLPPPKGYLQRLREITEKHGILLIFDEVITGFGRLGYPFAAERYGIVPDMITFAKGVTNGSVPMSGVMVRKQIYETHMQGPEHMIELFHGYTYSGHPLAVAAGLATLNIYRDEGLFEKARANEKVFAEAMMSLKGLPNVVDIRPIGLMCGIDLDPIPGKPGLRGYNAIEKMYHEHDLYVRVTMDTICVSPPLIATESDFAQIRDKIATVIKAVA
ncbi:MAG: aspartate aminotransferase family protein [Proteobacteria bacterium]|jgi:beta-alanine--pyruvate transaminase|nr:MAG: aspartate aminotransferase family protein [Pseudomonadota bacterium]